MVNIVGSKGGPNQGPPNGPFPHPAGNPPPPLRGSSPSFGVHLCQGVHSLFLKVLHLCN